MKDCHTNESLAPRLNSALAKKKEQHFSLDISSSLNPLFMFFIYFFSCYSVTVSQGKTGRAKKEWEHKRNSGFVFLVVFAVRSCFTNATSSWRRRNGREIKTFLKKEDSFHKGTLHDDDLGEKNNCNRIKDVDNKIRKSTLSSLFLFRRATKAE